MAKKATESRRNRRRNTEVKQELAYTGAHMLGADNEILDINNLPVAPLKREYKHSYSNDHN